MVITNTKVLCSWAHESYPPNRMSTLQNKASQRVLKSSQAMRGDFYCDLKYKDGLYGNWRKKHKGLAEKFFDAKAFLSSTSIFIQIEKKKIIPLWGRSQPCPPPSCGQQPFVICWTNLLLQKIIREYKSTAGSNQDKFSQKIFSKTYCVGVAFWANFVKNITRIAIVDPCHSF